MYNGFEWDEALSETLTTLHSGLLTLMAFRPDRSPKLIGTAFIVGAYGDHAVAVSAAHNFHEGAMNVQIPKEHRHPSALPEFLREISIDRQRFRAVYRINDHVEFCVIKSVVWDRKSDLALLMVMPQNINDKGVFEVFFRLEHIDPKIGDLVGMAGYGDMATVAINSDTDSHTFSTQSRIILRKGRVTGVFPDGHSLVRTKCIETTIPVFNGMSGGPVFLIPKADADIVPFGLISYDPEPDIFIEQKRDRSQSGASIAACLPIDVTNLGDDKRGIEFRLADVGVAHNDEF